MRKLTVFNHVTLDGYFTGPGGDLSWAHRASDDAEWNAFVAGNASGEGVLLFGRVTYQMMASFWPTPQALESNRVVAERMNGGRKVVFSRSLERAEWSNTTLVKEDLVGAVRAMKKETGPDMVILGSGRIVAQLAAEGVIDEYQLVVNPLALGAGRTMFEGCREPVPLRPTKTRTFGNGNILMCYEPKQ